MKAILVFFVLLIGGMIYLQHSLQNGSVLKYIDENRQARYVPEATYYIGEGYYLFQNLTEAATYFQRVVERYPGHALGDDSYFGYLQCRDDMASTGRAELIEGYKAYLEKYPEGRFLALASNRLKAKPAGPGHEAAFTPAGTWKAPNSGLEFVGNVRELVLGLKK